MTMPVVPDAPVVDAERRRAMLAQALDTLSTNIVDYKLTTDDETLLDEAALIVSVKDAADYEQAAEAVKGLAKLRRTLEAYWKPWKSPIDVLKRLVLARESAQLKLVGDHETRVERLTSSWAAAERRREAEVKAVAERAARDAAAAVRASQVQSLHQAAQATVDPGVAAAIQREADALARAQIVPQAVNVPSLVPKVAGISTTKRYRAKEPIDLMQLAQAVVAGKVPLDALLPNMSVINARVTATEGKPNWPGVEAEEVNGMTGRG